MRTQVPFGEAPVTKRVEALPDARREQQRGGRLANPALDLGRVVLLLRAVRGRARRARRSSKAAAARQGRLQQALRDRDRGSAGSAPSSACSRGPRARSAPRVAARADRGRTRRGRAASPPRATGRRSGRDPPPAASTGSAARASFEGSPGRCSPSDPASSTIFAHRSGERSTRRSEGKPFAVEEARRHAVRGDHEVLDEVLRAVAALRHEVGERAAVEDGPRLERLQAERAVRGPQPAELLARRGPGRAAARRSRALRRRARARARCRRARRPRSCRRAWRGCGRSARYTSESPSEPSGRTTTIDDDRLAVRAVAERREVGREPLGQHREDLRRRVDRRRVRARVGVDRPSPSSRCASTSAMATQMRHRAAPSAARRPRADRDRASRRCRSRPRAGAGGLSASRSGPRAVPLRGSRRSRRSPRARSRAGGTARPSHAGRWRAGWRSRGGAGVRRARS